MATACSIADKWRGACVCHPTIVLQAAALLQAPGAGCSSAVAMCWRQPRMSTLSSLTKLAPSQLASQWSRQVLSRCIVHAYSDCMQHWTTQNQSIHQRWRETHQATSTVTRQAVSVADGTGMDAAQILALAAALERRANHPIAAAIAAHAEQQGEHSVCCCGGVDPLLMIASACQHAARCRQPCKRTRPIKLTYGQAPNGETLRLCQVWRRLQPRTTAWSSSRAAASAVWSVATMWQSAHPTG